MTIQTKQNEGEVIEGVVYGCIKVLDGRIPDCKFDMHAKYFNEIRKNMLHNHDSKHDNVRNGRSVITLDKVKRCCHHRLRDLCAHTDGAWWKLKKYCTHEDIDNYLEFIICLKSFSIGIISPVNKST